MLHIRVIYASASCLEAPSHVRWSFTSSQILQIVSISAQDGMVGLLGRVSILSQHHHLRLHILLSLGLV